MNLESFRLFLGGLGVFVGLLTLGASAATPDHFRVGTYNLENYLDVSAGGRTAKSPAGRAQIRANLRELRADILALQEMGTTNAFAELQNSLRTDGIDYPYSDWVSGWDTNIHLALLSRFPIVRRQPHTNDTFLLYGRRFHVSRGFSEVEIEISPRYHITVLAAHLKSRRPVPEADEAELREHEGIALREHIDAILQRQSDTKLIVLGDLNDVHGSRAVRAVVGRKHSLVDTRPAERNGDSIPTGSGRLLARTVAWTHFYQKEDTYSRIDYVLISRSLVRDWQSEKSSVLATPGWGIASDHRPVVVEFGLSVPAR